MTTQIIVLATHSAAEFWQMRLPVAQIGRSETREQRASFNGAPGFRSAQPGLQLKKKEGSGTPADACLKMIRASGRGARIIEARSPVGVPLRLLLRRPNATAQPRRRASSDRLLPVPVQRAPRRPVLMPAGRICRSRSGADCKSARKHRTRSVFGCASRTRPSSERDSLVL
jgi:hypothetical protein